MFRGSANTYIACVSAHYLVVNMLFIVFVYSDAFVLDLKTPSGIVLPRSSKFMYGRYNCTTIYE